MVDDNDNEVMEEDSEDDEWLRDHNEELGLCPICGEDWCRSAH